MAAEAKLSARSQEHFQALASELREDARRQQLLEDGTVANLVRQLPILLDRSSQDAPDQALLWALRSVRNACAGGPPAAQALLQAGLPGHLTTLADRLLDKADQPGQGTLLAAFSQLLANLSTSSPAGAEAVWTLCFPSVFCSLAQQPGTVNVPATLALLSCCKASSKHSRELCTPGPAVGQLWSTLLHHVAPEAAKAGGTSGHASSSTPSGGTAASGASSSPPLRQDLDQPSNEWLPELVALLSVQEGLLEGLLLTVQAAGGVEGLGPTWLPLSIVTMHVLAIGLAAQSSSTDLAAMFQQQQQEQQQQQQEPGEEQSQPGPSGADLGGVANAPWRHGVDALLGVMDAAARACSDEGAATSLTQHMLEASLEAVRALCQLQNSGASSSAEAGSSGGGNAASVIAYLLQQQQLLHRTLAMLKALKPIKNPRKGEEGQGQGQGQPSGSSAADLPPAELAPQLRELACGFPAASPYLGYRGDLLAIVANLLYRRPQACKAVVECGAVELLLSQCQIDVQSPLAREWALWAVGSLLQQSTEAQQVIQELQLCTAVETPELQKLGLKMELDKSTGKLKVVKTDAANLV